MPNSDPIPLAPPPSMVTALPVAAQPASSTAPTHSPVAATPSSVTPAPGPTSSMVPHPQSGDSPIFEATETFPALTDTSDAVVSGTTAVPVDGPTRHKDAILVTEHQRQLLLSHQRLSHLNPQDIYRTAKPIPGLSLPPTTTTLPFCSGCALGKSRHRDRGQPVSKDNLRILRHLFVDLLGPIHGDGSYNYVLGVSCKFSNSHWLRYLVKKNDVLTQLVDIIKNVRLDFHRLFPTENFYVILRAVRDSVFLWEDLRDQLTDLGVDCQFSNPYAHWQLGPVERLWRTLIEATLSSMITASCPRRLWPLAFSHSSYVLLRRFSRTSGGDPGGVPLALLHPDKVFSLAHLRTFGCAAYVKVPDGKERKLNPKGVLKVFVGYSDLNQGYLVYDLTTRSVTTTIHVTFDESYFPFADGDPQPLDTNAVFPDLELSETVGAITPALPPPAESVGASAPSLLSHAEPVGASTVSSPVV